MVKQSTVQFVLKSLVLVFITMLAARFSQAQIKGQTAQQMIRIAKIQVDPAQLNNYKAALKESIMTSVSKEPGVLSYYAVADKANPAQITILEVYASPEAYQAHIQTPHFKKYKEAVKDMVKSLELNDVDLIASASKLSYEDKKRQ